MCDDTSSFLTFLRSESGSATLDWVVMAAASVGFGIAGMTVLEGGVQVGVASVRDQFQSPPTHNTSYRPDGPSAPFSTDFSTGASGWTGGAMVSLAGFGPVYQVGPGETARLTLDLPRDAARAVVSFDLLGLDDLAGEPALIQIDGTTVATYSDDDGAITLTNKGAPGISVTVEQLYDDKQVGAGSHGRDSRARYTISVADPKAILELAVVSTVDRPMWETFFAVDDVRVTAE